MIVRLDQKEIEALVQKQFEAMLEDLEIGEDHPVAELIEEHLEELYANILFRHEEIASEYGIPESVAEKEEEIKARNEELAKEMKEAAAEKAAQRAAKTDADDGEDDKDPPEPIRLSEKDARQVVFGEKRSPWGKSI